MTTFADNYCVFWVCWQIEVDDKYHDQLCGLCGNFDGQPNDVLLNGKIFFSIMVGKCIVVEHTALQEFHIDIHHWGL